MAAYAMRPVGVLRTADNTRLTPQSGQAWDEYILWRQAGNVPDPYIEPVPPAETLVEAKLRRRWEIKRAGMQRIQVRFPAIDSFDALQLVRELYLSIAPAARQPTADWQWLINTFAAGQTALDAVAAATTIAQVDAVSPAWPA